MRRDSVLHSLAPFGSHDRWSSFHFPSSSILHYCVSVKDCLLVCQSLLLLRSELNACVSRSFLAVSILGIEPAIGGRSLGCPNWILVLPAGLAYSEVTAA